jgi:hypothetical protein
VVFELFGALLLRNLSSTLPTESLFISAIVTSSAAAPGPTSQALKSCAASPHSDPSKLGAASANAKPSCTGFMIAERFDR